ncbi:MAG: hydroxymethylbilane synthase [Omnitrophica bacterium RIFCSPLOWO2_01_FULL_45_10]|nr:MAG: hydroxymethylbilane synthase [Omnitrophica bacterium RIFCSPLOWO2_01_FULL_45_10]
MAKNNGYKVGIRRSILALRQFEEALSDLRKFYPRIEAEPVRIETYGDRDRRTPISDIEGSDFFTREIEESLLKGEIDFAVHSAKDLPDRIPDGLQVAAITGSIDPYDALVSKGNLKIDELATGARIGTSSARRKSQLKSYRPDFNVVDIRGNIDERLKLLDNNDIRHSAKQSEASPKGTKYDIRNIDAIVISSCALVRLGLEKRITQRLPFEIVKPHPLQGSLALEARKINRDIINLVSVLDRK